MPVDRDKIKALAERINKTSDRDYFRKYFAGGGPEGGTVDPALEEYKNKKRQEVIDAAYQKSLDRTEPKVPMIMSKPEITAGFYDDVSKQLYDEASKYINDGAYFNKVVNEFGEDEVVAGSPLMYKDKDKFDYWVNEADAAMWEAGKWRKEEPVLMQGPSCIATATDNYGDKYYVSGNQTFIAEPGKYGFSEISLSDVRKGDLVQSLSGLTGTPTHAMIFDGYDGEGRPLFNYSDGGNDPGAIRKRQRYFRPDDFTANRAKAYRFVGNSDDNELWEREYNDMIGQKAYGGTLLRAYDDGGPIGEDDPMFIGPVLGDREPRVVQVPQQRDNTATAFNPSRAYVTDAQVSRAANAVANKDIMLDDNPMGFAPVVGDALQAGQVIMDALDGKYGRAALSAALLAVPNIIEKPAKSVIRAIATAIRKSPGSRVTEEVYKALGRAVNTEGTGEVLSDTVVKGLAEKYRVIYKSLEDAGVDMSHITDDDLWRLERGRRMDLQDYVDEGNKINVARPDGDRYFEIIGFSDTYPTGYIRLGGKGGGQVPDVPGAHVDYVANLTDKKFRGLISEDEIERLADRGIELGPDEYVEHGIQQRMTDAAIRLTKESDKGLSGVISGEVLLTPEATSKMYDKYPGRIRVGDNGRWHYGSGDLKEGPIYLLTSPTSTDVPTKMFNYVEGFPYMYDPMRLKDGHYQILVDDIFKSDGGLMRKYEEGGPEGDGEYVFGSGNKGYMINLPKNTDIPKEAVVRPPLTQPSYFYDNERGYYIPGFSNITKDINDGDPQLYSRIFIDYWKPRFYRHNDTGDIFKLFDMPQNHNINLDDYTEVPYGEIRKMLPKRDYIGGEGYRLKTAQRIPGFIDKIAERAEAYGINPNLLLHRILKEGFIDQNVNRYNNISAKGQDGYWERLWDEPVDGFASFGLDDAGSNLLSGKYVLLDKNASWLDVDNTNELGRRVVSVETPDLSSALEIKAAEMAYRQRELAKRGLNGDAYVNAAYNGGLNWDRLNDADFVRRRYSVPDYGVFGKGGKIHIKESKKGTFTAAAKWHADGGAIGEAIGSGRLDILNAAINNVLNKKLKGK